MATAKQAPPDDGGNIGAEPSSHDTCGQFPADEVRATHAAIDPDPDTKAGVAEPDTKAE